MRLEWWSYLHCANGKSNKLFLNIQKKQIHTMDLKDRFYLPESNLVCWWAKCKKKRRRRNRTREIHLEQCVCGENASFESTHAIHHHNLKRKCFFHILFAFEDVKCVETADKTSQIQIIGEVNYSTQIWAYQFQANVIIKKNHIFLVWLKCSQICYPQRWKFWFFLFLAKKRIKKLMNRTETILSIQNAVRASVYVCVCGESSTNLIYSPHCYDVTIRFIRYIGKFAMQFSQTFMQAVCSIHTSGIRWINVS